MTEEVVNEDEVTDLMAWMVESGIMVRCECGDPFHVTTTIDGVGMAMVVVGTLAARARERLDTTDTDLSPDVLDGVTESLDVLEGARRILQGMLGVDS